MSKVALVTGASRGIGRSIALALAEAGYAVVVNFALRRGDADATMAAIAAGGGTAVALQADVSDAVAVARMFAAVDERFGRLDALVNNAGIGRRIDRLTDIDDETWRRTLAVNLDGAFFCTRAAVPRLKAAGGGRIVNVSSGAAVTPSFGRPSYTATKLALEGLTQALAHELAGRVAVNCIRIDMPIWTEGFDATLPEDFDTSFFEDAVIMSDAVLWLVGQGVDYTGHVLTLGELRARGIVRPQTTAARA
jgi:3-oxoacyl-[acyl-carrier protein] reductase